MNRLVVLLILIGLGVAGWVNRDRISEYFGQHKAEVAVAEPTPTPTPAPTATPNPAAESIALARKAYPALAVSNSPFNLRFVENYNALKTIDPNFLRQPDWPMKLAERTAKEISASSPGAATTPVPPNGLTSSLDGRPGGPNPTVVPTVALPGLTGSALDQRPKSARQH